MLNGLVAIQLVYFYIPPIEEDEQSSGSPIFPIYVTQQPILVVLNVITILATAGRVFDAVTDPLIASLSDRLHHPRGRRIPCLFVGAVPACVSCALLFVPIEPSESGWNVLWLAMIQAVFYFFLTIYVTPYFALLPELGHTATERLHLATWIAITFAIGETRPSADHP